MSVKKIDGGRVFYVEPNYNGGIAKRNNIITNNENTEEVEVETVMYEQAPLLEDYCVAIEMQALIKNEEINVYDSKNNQSIEANNGYKAITFLGGSTFNAQTNTLQSNGDIEVIETSTQAWTTAPYEFTTYADINGKTDKLVNSEMFGIESINIQYNNYCVPQVDITFKDIRGISLFAAEELRHDVTSKGIRNNANNSIGGSFFKCFFTFPFPKFRLMVKGFYGYPTSYELTCTDFNASFECSTGSFKATARFVGYMYSLLNDITMNAVSVAPYDLFKGADYWEQQVKQNVFVFDDGRPMKKIGEVIKIWSNIQAEMKEVIAEDDNVQAMSGRGYKHQTENKAMAAQHAFVALEKYVSFYKNIEQINNCFRAIYDSEEQPSIIGIYSLSEEKDFYQDVLNKISDYKTLESELKSSLEALGENISRAVYQIQPQRLTHRDKFVTMFNDESRTKNVPSDVGSYYYVRLKEAYDSIQAVATNATQENEATEANTGITDATQEKINQIMASNLDFVPSVKNMTKLVLAHLDTLNHCIYETSKIVTDLNKQGKRPISAFNVDFCDNRNETQVPAFPKLAKFENENGTDILTEQWIGDLVSDDIAPEINLIHGLLKGTEELENVVSEAAEINAANEEKYDESGYKKPPMNTRVLGGLIDVTSSKRFNACQPKFDNVSSVFGYVLLNAMSTLGLNSNEDTSRGQKQTYTAAANDLGKIDAINFAVKHNSPSKYFIDLLTGGTLTKDSVIQGLLGQNDELFKKNGESTYGWGSSEPLLVKKTSSYDYIFNDNVTFGQPSTRYSDDSVSTGVKFISNGKLIRLFGDWDTTILDKNNLICSMNSDYASIMHVYRDYNAYMHLGDLCVYGDRVFDKAKELFNSKSQFYFTTYNDKFFNKDGSEALGTKVTNNVKFYKSDCLIPPERPTIINTENTSFGDKAKPMNPEATCAYIDGEEFQIRDANDSFSDLFNENFETAISNYTIPSFHGIGIEQNYGGERRGTKYVSIFGQPQYYSQFEEYEKAVMFLESFRWYDETKLFKENDSHGFNINKVINFLAGDDVMGFPPYMAILLLGGYLTIEGEGKVLSVEDENLSYSRQITYTDLDLTKLHGLRREIKTTLKNEFDKWLHSSASNGWLNIKSNYELRGKRGNTDINFIDWLGSNLREGYKNFMNSPIYDDWIIDANGHWILRTLNDNNDKYILNKDKFKTFEGFLAYYFDDNLFKNYCSIASYPLNQTNIYPHCGFKLFNRENQLLDDITNLLVRPCAVIFTSNNKSDSVDCKIKISTSNLKEYLKGFLTQLTECYCGKTSSSDEGTPPLNSTIAPPDHTTVDVKLTLYKYIKNLYDRWLSGNDESLWALLPLEQLNVKKGSDGRKSFFEHFHFIDVYYNNVGDLINMPLSTFCNAIISSQEKYGYSLLSFLGKIYGEVRFNVSMVQNFLNFNGSDDDGAKLQELFTPIPYAKIKLEDIDYTPDFVIMYTYEYSSKIGDENFIDDGMDINPDSETLPVAISSKNMDYGYPVPAFGVTYGMQYQSYFKDINVGIDSSMITEQSIQTQYMIASSNRKRTSDNGTDEPKQNSVAVIGQDLYTIYSNNSYKCEVSMMGCAYIQPLMYFQLNNVPMFHGAYLIEKVTHSIRPGSMETKFIGVRVPNVANKKVKDWIIKVGNDDTSDGGDKNDKRAEIASVENNCDYKVFPVNNGTQGIGLTEEQLNMTLKEFADSVGASWKVSSISKVGERHVKDRDWNIESDKLIDLLAATAYNEAGILGDVGLRSTITVIFNLMKQKGLKTWVNTWFSVPRHATGRVKEYVGKYNDDKLRLAVRDIFVNSPLTLVGQEAVVTHPMPIWKDKEVTTKNTKTKTITMNDVQTINTYCSRQGYDANYKGGGCEEKPSLWHIGPYHFQTDDPTDRYSHVYTSCENDEKLWEATHANNQGSSDNENPSRLAKGLFDAIKSTCDFSKELGITSLTMNPSVKGKANAFEITCEPSDKLYQVFDVVLNAYYNYIYRLNWIVDNDNGSASPTKIVVEAESDAENRGGKKWIGIAKPDNSQACGYSFLNQYDNLNKYFYMSLYKKYGKLSDNANNAARFKNDNGNFVSLISSDSNWKTEVDKILEIVSKDIKDCPLDGDNNGMVNNNHSFTIGYSWFPNGTTVEYTTGGSRKSPQYQISSKGTLNVNKLVQLAKQHQNKKNWNNSSSSTGKCLRCVKDFLSQAGLNIDGQLVWAAQAYNVLPYYGFKKIYEGCGRGPGSHEDKYKEIAQEGDIIVIAGQNPSPPRQDKPPYQNAIGHIEVVIKENDKLKYITDLHSDSIHPYSWDSNTRRWAVFRYNR